MEVCSALSGRNLTTLASRSISATAQFLVNLDKDVTIDQQVNLGKPQPDTLDLGTVSTQAAHVAANN